MKYTETITIDLPREQVISLFDNPENMEKWMEGLLGYEHLSGEPGTLGSKTSLRFQMGKRQIEMTETITALNWPDSMTSTYETKGVYNTVISRFRPLSDTQTEYVSEQEFRFDALPMKLMGWLMPGAFRKQSRKYLQDFKKFAEGVQAK